MDRVYYYGINSSRNCKSPTSWGFMNQPPRDLIKTLFVEESVDSFRCIPGESDKGGIPLHLPLHHSSPPGQL